MDAYDTLVKRIVEGGGMAVVLGGLDTGKSSFCKLCAEVAVRVGKKVAYLDTDIGQSTVGPPSTIGLRFVESLDDLSPDALAQADHIAFVGSMTPRGHMVEMVVGATRLAEIARAEGADLIVVDTTGYIDGMAGQMLKFHKIEALRPEWVVGFQRGAELEPVLGAVKRALPPEVSSLPVSEAILPTTVDERMESRRARLRAVFEQPVFRWKVKPSVFVPPVPEDIDLSQLDGILVGMEDGKGNCLGLGILECSEDGLRMRSQLDQAAKALRLGSVRVTPEYGTVPVDLRDIFISD